MDAPLPANPKVVVPASTAAAPTRVPSETSQGARNENEPATEIGQVANSIKNGLAAKAAALLVAGADKTWLAKTGGGDASGSSDYKQTTKPEASTTKTETLHTTKKEAPETPIPSAVADADAASEKTPVTFSISSVEVTEALHVTAAVSPLTPEERQGLSSIHQLALNATLEMNTLRDELEKERKKTSAYASELGKLRVGTTAAATAAYASVSHAGATAKDAEAIRTALVARAAVAEKDAFIADRRAGDLEKSLHIERERNAQLLGALNAAGDLSKTANESVAKRARDAEELNVSLRAELTKLASLRRELTEVTEKLANAELRATRAELCVEEAMHIAAEATSNAEATARNAEEFRERNKSGTKKVLVPKKTNSGPSAATTFQNAVPKTPTRVPLREKAGYTAAFAPQSATKQRAKSPGRRCSACASRNWHEACVSCDASFGVDVNDISLEVTVPTAAGATEAWRGTLRSTGFSDLKAGVSPSRRSIDRDDVARSSHGTDAPAPSVSSPRQIQSRWAASVAKTTGVAFASKPAFPIARRSLAETVATASLFNNAEVRAVTAEKTAFDFDSLRDAVLESTRVSTETAAKHSARVGDLEANMAVTLAELELDRERRDERRAAVSPGAENRRRRRRERMEVAAKLDATEGKLRAMRVEDIRKAKLWDKFLREPEPEDVPVVEPVETINPNKPEKVTFFQKTQKSLGRASSKVGSIVSSGVRSGSSLVSSMSPVGAGKKEKESSPKNSGTNVAETNVASPAPAPSPRSAPVPPTPVPKMTQLDDGFGLDFS